jgi:hypothetical protein
MTNLAISAVCNQKCPYCFTTDHLGAVTHREAFVTIEAFEASLDFLDRSHMDEVRLLGGEPTLHPQFPQLVTLALARHKKITVFSNGLMPEQSAACLAELPPGECTVIVNVGSPVPGSDDVFLQQSSTLRRLASQALVGFNIYRPDFQAEFLLPLVKETGCRPMIRLGLAQPCLSGANEYLRPVHYQFVGAKITRLAQAAARWNVKLAFDCGFVRCMFSDRDLATLKTLEADVGWQCGPIPDVDTTGQVIHCYPLSRFLRLPLTLDADAPAWRQVFEQHTQPYRQAGIFQECSTCFFKQSKECSGGCLSLTMRRFRHVPFRLRIPAGEERER